MVRPALLEDNQSLGCLFTPVQSEYPQTLLIKHPELSFLCLVHGKFED